MTNLPEIPPGIPVPRRSAKPTLEQKIAAREADLQYSYSPRKPATHIPERAGPDRVHRDQMLKLQHRLDQALARIIEHERTIHHLSVALAKAEHDIKLLTIHLDSTP